MSPASSYSRSPVIPGGVDTEVILRSDLKSIKRSRIKGWFWFFVAIMAFGALTVIEFNERARLVSGADYWKKEFEDANRLHKETLARLGVSERIAEEARTAATAAGESAASAVEAIGSATRPTSDATAQLVSALKTELSGSAVSVEARGDNAIMSLDPTTLFAESKFDIGLSGYRVLYRFGKALKTVTDRQIVISVPARDGAEDKTWYLAAARGVALGRFLVNDLKVAQSRVTVLAEPEARGQTKVEFSLRSVPAPAPKS